MGWELSLGDLEGPSATVNLLLNIWHVDIFYLRGLLASLALIYNAVVAGLQHCWNSLYFRKTLLWNPTGISADTDRTPAALARIFGLLDFGLLNFEFFILIVWLDFTSVFPNCISQYLYISHILMECYLTRLDFVHCVN